MIVAISLAVYLAISLINSLTPTPSGLLGDLISNLGLDSAYRSITDVSTVFRFLWALTMSTPVILECIGLWLSFGAGLDRSGKTMKTAGFSLIKASAIFMLVVFVLATVLGFILFIITMIGASEASRYAYGYGSSVGSAVSAGTGAAVLVFFVAFGVLGLIMAWYSSLGNFFDRLKGIAVRDVPTSSLSAFPAVMCFIAATFGLIFGLISTGMSFLLSSSGVISLLSSFSLSVTWITLGILMLQVRGTMRSLTDTYFSRSPYL